MLPSIHPGNEVFASPAEEFEEGSVVPSTGRSLEKPRCPESPGVPEVTGGTSLRWAIDACDVVLPDTDAFSDCVDVAICVLSGEPTIFSPHQCGTCLSCKGV